MDNIPTKAKILAGAGMTEAKIEYFRRKAPYYPKRHTEIHVNEELFQKHLYATTIVRHEHEGVWYARHHLQEQVIANDDTHTPTRVEEHLLHEVYLDLRFGKINPDIKRPNGKSLDPVDKLQISESERLLGVKG